MSSPLAAQHAVERSLAALAGAATQLGAIECLATDHARARAAAMGDSQSVTPFAAKDLLDVEGLPTFGGSAQPLVSSAASTAVAIRGLEAAGGVLCAKTTLPEFAYGGWGTNTVRGTPRNPWDRTRLRVPGGSSSGSAIAVALRAVPLAIGTDTGGSARIPAAFCGIVGLRPSRDRVSRQGLHCLSRTLDAIGPMGVDVATVARALGAMQTRDGSASAVDRFEWSPPVRDGCDVTTKLRIGALPAAMLAPCEPEVAAAYRAALARFRDLGANVVEVTLPRDPEAYIPLNGVVLRYEAWKAFGAVVRERADTLDPHVRARLESGATISRAAYEQALVAMHAERRHFARLFDTVDLLATPTVPLVAPPLDALDEHSLACSTYTRAFNYLDLPALSVPCGTSANGLPIGLQLVAPPWQELRALQAGWLYERIRGPFPGPSTG